MQNFKAIFQDKIPVTINKEIVLSRKSQNKRTTTPHVCYDDGLPTKSSLMHSDGHSGATSAATFSVAEAAGPLLFFVTSKKWQRRCFFSQKSGSASALFLSRFSAAAATADNSF